ncbi:MAG: lysostaphin resistance A-like protein [Hyphomicrobiaceae bacterium]
MSTQSFRAFLIGPVRWRPQSPWHPALAVLAAIVIVVLGQLIPALLLATLGGAPFKPSAPDTVSDMFDGAVASALIVGQVALALLTVAAASLFGGRFTEVLSLERPDPGPRSYLYAVLLLLPVLAIVNALAFGLNPSGFRADFAQFERMTHGADPLAAFLAIAVGAPLWEEMLFRGFLFGPLIGPLGFWPAAVLVSGTWTVLHIGYSTAGLAEVFLIGLYFSWLLRRTGSLWVPIACHALYNGALFVLIRFWPG